MDVVCVLRLLRPCFFSFGMFEEAQGTPSLSVGMVCRCFVSRQ